MKSKKSSDNGKLSDKRSVKDLPPSKTKGVKGGSSAHEMKKVLIGNLPR